MVNHRQRRFFFPAPSLKQLVEQPVRIELHQIVVALADTGEHDRSAGGIGDGKPCAALCVGVHFGQHRSIKPHDFLEHFRLFNRIVACQGVTHKEGKVRVRDLSDFVEFVHQVGLVLHASGGIDEDDVNALGFRRIDGVTSDGGRVASSLAGNASNAQPFAMRFQLLNGSRTERVACGGDDAAAVVEQPLGNLGGRGGLPGTVHTHEHDHNGKVASFNETVHRGVKVPVPRLE